jgi:hypothetical protein
VLRDRRHHLFEGRHLFLHGLSLFETLFRFDVLRGKVGGHGARITKRTQGRVSAIVDMVYVVWFSLVPQSQVWIHH